MTRDASEIAREVAYELRGDQLPWSNRGTAIMDRALLADRIAAAIEQDRAEREAWLPIESAPRDARILLLMGETIPDTPDVRVGAFIAGDEAEELGYREYAKHGGWLIWNSGSDFYVEDVELPTGWRPLPSPPSEER